MATKTAGKGGVISIRAKGSECLCAGNPYATIDELKRLLSSAAAQGLCTYCVADAGRTQVAPGTETVGCIGPAPVSRIDAVTGHLQLL